MNLIVLHTKNLEQDMLKTYFVASSENFTFVSPTGEDEVVVYYYEVLDPL